MLVEHNISRVRLVAPYLISYGWIFARRRFIKAVRLKLLVPVGKAWFQTGGQTFFASGEFFGGGKKKKIILWLWLSTWQWGEHLRVIWHFPDGLSKFLRNVLRLIPFYSLEVCAGTRGINTTSSYLEKPYGRKEKKKKSDSQHSCK